LLEHQDALLAREFQDQNMGALFPFVLTLRRAPLQLTLLEGMGRACETFPDTPLSKTFQLDLEKIKIKGNQDTRALLSLLERFSTLVREQGYVGVLLVLDELGKALEHAARHEAEDIYLLQELAETASRSGQTPLFLVGVLHQAFDQYGEHLSLSTRKEWGKVQGRFADLAFLEPPEQQIRLAARAVEALGFAHGQNSSVAQTLAELGLATLGIAKDEFVTLCEQAAPLHPTVLIALPHLFRRFAQNERSLFAYLLSGEAHALPDVWRARANTVRLPDLFDYFATNLLGSLSRQALARRWLEVLDALERSPDLSALEREVLKAVGVLSVLGEVSPLQAGRETLSLALADTSEDSTVRGALERLEARKLIVYRRFNHTYKVWEGSDVDLEEQLELARRQVAGQFSLAESLAKYLPARPLVARRHSFETGALRFFALHYLDNPDGLAHLTVPLGADGVLVCALPGQAEGAARFLELARSSACAGRFDLIVAVPQHLRSLREAALELRALHWVRENVSELRDDRVARRELNERLAYLENTLERSVTQLLDPRPEPRGSGTLYLYRGEVQNTPTPRVATELLSSAMDQVYSQAPHLLNELLNRRVLSSAAAAARRTLLERMLTQHDSPSLGIEGFPPERSMYESVLHSTGIHAEREDGWGFAAPDPAGSARLTPAWNALSSRVFAAMAEPISLEHLFAELSTSPYGVLPGVMPVLFTAFWLAHAQEVSLYREGAFIPEPGMADLEVLMRRPELFAVAGSELSGERAAVLERLGQSLNVPSSLVSVVRALVRMVRSLPDTAWRVKDMSPDIVRVREVFERAKSPEKLLFVDLPGALELPPFGSSEDAPQTLEPFFERLNATIGAWSRFAPDQILWARDLFLNACDLPPTSEGWQTLREKVAQLEPKSLNQNLVPLISRLQSAPDDASALESALALIAGRAPRTWQDADRERFPAQAQAMGERYGQGLELNSLVAA